MTAGKTSHLTKNLIHKMTNLAIDIQDLSVTFKDFKALQKLKLQVAKGSAMALLGQNGAGKTTTLRTLVNIYAAQQGSGSLLGFPLGSDSSEFFQKIGYVSENQKLPSRWTIAKLIDYLRPQYPTWDDELCQSLLETFELSPKYRIGQLSRGMFMKTALLSSMAYRPELLILDEPFSGLDPLVREELIDAILDLMNGENWTVLLSSHDVHEVEQLCDHVTILNHGTTLLSESLESLQTRFRLWNITTQAPDTVDPEKVPSTWILMKALSPNSWTFIDTAHDPAAPLDPSSVFGPLAGQENNSLSLKEIYLALAKNQKNLRRSF